MPTATIQTKFFHFPQNNSGGSFDFDEGKGITKNVIIEATSHGDANSRAEAIGLYFDGDGDCPCCGNRWSSQYDDGDGTESPSIYGSPVDAPVEGSFKMKWMKQGKETAVHYIDGRIEWYA
jgi:hypothetical protein